MFRKPKRNVRQRTTYSDEEDENGGDHHDEDKSTLETIEKFKESKKKIVAKDKNSAAKKSSLLDFDGFDAETEGEVFRVKKSSQSRKLKKQIKAERKMREKGQDSVDLVYTPPLPSTPLPTPPPSITEEEADDIGAKVKNNLVINKVAPPETRLLSGYEAEALHMEEEDESDDEDDNDKDPLQEILKGGAIPDAAAIYAARKRRQAAREKGTTAPEAGPQRSGFISLKKDEPRKAAPEQDQDSEDDEDRIVMAGVRTNAELRKESLNTINEEADVIKDDDDKWEEMQIRKAMKTLTTSASHSPSMDNNDHFAVEKTSKYVFNDPPASYTLEGIKDRIKKRITSLEEVHRRHLNDIDKIDDELITSQSMIVEKQARLPVVVEKHHFYQDLRGYAADLVECFDEKLSKIKFVEEKYFALKADVFQKLINRRREDVRDQMRELSSNNSKPLIITAEENNEEWDRQRRAAEREGRRRRRAQLRQAKMGQSHNDGMSSDDELSSHDQATISKSRQDVENQARTIMVDVVEEFSTIDGILSRMQEWKSTDSTAYNEAYVALCLPKMVAPLVTLQLLFWNPLEDHASLEDMDWHNSLAMYCHNLDPQAEDNLLSLVMEKVVLLKINSMVKAAYDPFSTSQTLRLTQLLTKLRSTYPTLTGTSKQVRELLSNVIDRIKSSVDQDLYIPLGYSKQYLENPLSGHSIFLNRQFWGCFKLFKNILTWQGLLADKVLVENAFNSILYRYLIIGLGVTQNPIDCVNKCRHIVSVMPIEWRTKMKNELDRFVKYLSALGATPGLPRESVKEVVQQLKTLGASQECQTLERTRLL